MHLFKKKIFLKFLKKQFSFQKKKFSQKKTNFQTRLEKMENEYTNKNPKEINLKNLLIPSLIIFLSASTYYLQPNEKEKKKYEKNLTISKKSFKQNPESLILSSFNINTSEQIFLYFPGLCFSLFFLSNRLKNFHFLSLFTYNLLISLNSIVFYERNFTMANKNLEIPKNNGSTTSLFFMAFFAGFSPGFRIFNLKFLPFWFYPIFLGYYEYLDWKNSYVKELSKPAHFVALANGLISGIVLRRFKLI